jgi:hypothetical protein
VSQPFCIFFRVLKTFVKTWIATHGRKYTRGMTIKRLDHVSVVVDDLAAAITFFTALGYQPPEEFEQQLSSAATFAAATMSFFRHGEDYRPDDKTPETRSSPQTAPPTIGFDESPAGYSLASCSPAELASASPADADSATTGLV